MTIQREYRSGPFVVMCDRCDVAEEIEGDHIRDAAANAKAQGYTPVFAQGAWEHVCSYCSQNLA